MRFILWLDEIKKKEAQRVGGKNYALAQMIQSLTEAGVLIPNGFAVTTEGYLAFIEQHGIKERLAQLVGGITKETGATELQKISAEISKIFEQHEVPAAVVDQISVAYEELSRNSDVEAVDVAVRSSATAEDLPFASFAGQHETFLYVNGVESVVQAYRRCLASLFTARALIYRVVQGIEHMRVAMSVGIQRMVRSDLASSGVAFGVDVETGFRNAIMITASYGVGEAVVQGTVNPDEYQVFKPALREGYRAIIRKYCGSKDQKMVLRAGTSGIEDASSLAVDRDGSDSEPESGSDGSSGSNEHMGKSSSSHAGEHQELVREKSDRIGKNHDTGPLVLVSVSKADRERFSLTDDEILHLARQIDLIEDYYSRLAGKYQPMDVEWAKDGVDQKIYIVQARPETVHAKKEHAVVTFYRLEEDKKREVVLSGLAVGSKIITGRLRVIDQPIGATVAEDEIIVTGMTNPDWMPLLRHAAGLITDHGGRTSHAAIVCRELGIPGLIGTGHATKILIDGEEVTVDCSQGATGYVYKGLVPFEVEHVGLADDAQPLSVGDAKLMLNIGDPDHAYRLSRLPVYGVGLARIEFIMTQAIGVHPMALATFEQLDKSVQEKIREWLVPFNDPREAFIRRLSEGIGMIAAAFYPRSVLVRFSDLKSNEYRNLIGGRLFEQVEENPMLGFRGAARYTHPEYAPAFLLEVEAVLRARNVMGLKNINLMIPFVRSKQEAERVLGILCNAGLERGVASLEVWMMVEIPSNALLIDEFAPLFDGFSIGSNDLTQFVLAVDRDSARLAPLFDERNLAVIKMIKQIIEAAHAVSAPVSICGEAPSLYPEMMRQLSAFGIDQISLNPDGIVSLLRKTA